MRFPFFLMIDITWFKNTWFQRSSKLCNVFCVSTSLAFWAFKLVGAFCPAGVGNDNFFNNAHIATEFEPRPSLQLFQSLRAHPQPCMTFCVCDFAPLEGRGWRRAFIPFLAFLSGLCGPMAPVVLARTLPQLFTSPSSGLTLQFQPFSLNRWITPSIWQVHFRYFDFDRLSSHKWSYLVISKYSGSENTKIPLRQAINWTSLIQ